MSDTRTDWQRHMGVGERQLRDSVVADTKRTHTYAVTNEDTGRVGGEQIEHRSGRVDAVVRPDTVRVTVAGASKEILVNGR